VRVLVPAVSAVEVGRAIANRRPPAGDNGVMAETDAAVIAASIGEPERFGVVFERHATVLFRYFVRRVGVDVAGELLGELFRVAFERRSTYDAERADARPWLYGIATRLLARHRRSEARRIAAVARLLAGRTASGDVEDRVASMVDASELWPAMAAAIDRLPDVERDVLLLRVWEELSYQEIATALDVPVGTVRSRLNRARSRLREPQAARGR
jgi:RNA polymerase sigma-70 factor (ECF subfamily)